MDDDEEEAWVEAQRENVARYLSEQPLIHGEIGEWPAWHLAPLVSIWSVESVKRPGWVGWWVISGDGPTDYCSADNRRHPRLALREFARTWRAYAAEGAAGAEVLGESGLPAHLGPLLAEKAARLDQFATDDELWPDEIYGD